GIKYPVISNILRKVLRNADYLFADGIDLSRGVKRIAGKECMFLPSAKADVKYKKINVNIDAKKKNILFVGRLDKVKGIDVLVDAVKLTKRKDFNLYVLGGGPLGSLKNEKLNNVFFKGFVSQEVVSNYLGKCDFVVIPSRNESIPLVLVEAIKAKKPVIVTDVGDMGYLVSKYNLGEVVKPNSAVALKNGIEEFLDEGKKGYKKGMSNLAKEFDLRSIVKKFEAIVKKRIFIKKA
ncbi:unnamed protein product, partial [marine sediment metagenome]